MRNLPKDPFFDEWETTFKKHQKRAVGALIAIVIANLIVWGVAIWGFIELVKWVTSK